MNFGDAIRALKQGKWARRAGWNGENMHIYLEKASSFKIGDGIFKGQVRTSDPYLCMFTPQGTHQAGWMASQADMLAEDWEVANVWDIENGVEGAWIGRERRA